MTGESWNTKRGIMGMEFDMRLKSDAPSLSGDRPFLTRNSLTIHRETDQMRGHL